ncbi:AN1-type domain-containing protein [Trichostrongylus colubriformis]|uniref:AN1-type domain-containing protein n=1 Tax=Trichostrongylus colubriformis TaxID=6319 RepID=A0AAN8IQY4_TRICO
MEHEITRNKMKALLQKRRRSKLLSSSSPRAISPGSVLSRSPLTEPASPFERSEKTAKSSRSSPIVFPKDNTNNPNMVTEKELKLFFEPPESVDELERKQQELCLVPETEEELEKRRKELTNLEKTICKLCRRKLTLPDQEMRCLCESVFCKRHREPSKHFCHIDYKGASRSKIAKENPKMVSHGSETRIGN